MDSKGSLQQVTDTHRAKPMTNYISHTSRFNNQSKKLLQENHYFFDSDSTITKSTLIPCTIDKPPSGTTRLSSTQNLFTLTNRAAQRNHHLFENNQFLSFKKTLMEKCGVVGGQFLQQLKSIIKSKINITNNPL